MNSSVDNWRWQPPAHWLTIGTLDLHSGGEPLRVFTSGLPSIGGRTVLEKRRYFQQHYDHLRTGILWEPRGHADMYGAVVTESVDADFDVFFLHNEGYSSMCGHAIIALTKLIVESGLARGPSVTFSVPAGRIEATARIESGVVVETSFRNVPSFVLLRDQRIVLEGIGEVPFDVAYGGAFYAIVDACAVNVSLTVKDCNRLIDIGRRIKRVVAENFLIEHPFEPDLSFLYGTIFTGSPAEGNHSRNVCIFADGEVDRSATGSGVSARAVLLCSRGELPLNCPVTIESILGSTMTVRAIERTRFGAYDAVIPEVKGSAHITGRSEWYFDPDDGLGHGFIVR